MPYFGKTEWGILDEHGPMSVAVYHISERGKHGLQYPVCVALDVGVYIFLHAGKLYGIGGKIKFVQLVESLPRYKGFSLSEKEILNALVEWKARKDADVYDLLED
jgi:hypothetical protein